MLDNLIKFESIVRKTKENITSNVDSVLHSFDERNIHPEIIKISKKLFDDGHYSQATFEAFKYIDKKVQQYSQLKESGYKLMMQAFNESSPRIKINLLSNPSDIDEQAGYKFIFSGCSMAIRNPRGHEYLLSESLDECLDHLSLASLLARRLDASTSA